MTNVFPAQGCECGSSAPVSYMACVGGCARSPGAGRCGVSTVWAHLPSGPARV